MLTLDQFCIIQNIQTSPVLQTSFLVGTFFAVSYSKPALVSMCTVLSPRIILSLVITLALADFCVLTTRWRTFAFVVLTILAYPVTSSSHVFTNSETTNFFHKIFFALFFYEVLIFFLIEIKISIQKSQIEHFASV